MEAAIAVGADGLHIGQDDIDAITARQLIGPNMILGLSAETAALAAAIDPAAVDYAGLGPVFATATKPDHKPALGTEGLSRLIKVCPVPVVAIGGLKSAHVGTSLPPGPMGLRLSPAICGTPDPQLAAREIAKNIQMART